MTANEIKKRFAEHFLSEYVIANELRDLACSDIVAIDRNLNIREYEIKISISDLRRELKEIDFILAHTPLEYGYGNYGENKRDKHHLFLNGLTNFDRYKRELPSFYCPATYSFLITRKLYEKEKERIDELPYGVMDSETFQILKPAKHLKEAKKASALQLWKVAHSQNYKLFGGRNE